jgi:hypothetical protein
MAAALPIYLLAMSGTSVALLRVLTGGAQPAGARV